MTLYDSGPGSGFDFVRPTPAYDSDISSRPLTIAEENTGPVCFGPHLAGAVLASGSLGAVYVCDTDPTRIIKVVEPRAGFFDADEAAARVEEFLTRSQVQRDVADAGAEYWTPVYDIGRTDAGGAYAVVANYPRSVRRLFNSQLRLPAAKVQNLFEGILQGLSELRAVSQRCHLRLVPSNVLLDGPSDGELIVKLADPAAFADLGPSFEKADLTAIGKMLYQAVLQSEVPAMFVGPVAMSDAWKRLGASAEKWRSICDALLHPSGPQIDFDTLVAKVGQVKRRSSTLTPKGQTPRPATPFPPTPSPATRAPGTRRGTPAPQDDVGAEFEAENLDAESAYEDEVAAGPYTTPLTMQEDEEAPPAAGRFKQVLRVGIAAIAVAGAAGALAMLSKPPPDALVELTKPTPPTSRPVRPAPPLVARLNKIFKDVTEPRSRELQIEAKNALASGRPADSLKLLNVLEQLRPGDRDALVLKTSAQGLLLDLQAGRAALDKNDYINARKLADGILARMPNQPDAVSLRESAVELEKKAKLLADLDRRLADAKELERTGKLAGAAIGVREILDIDPNHAGAKALSQSIESQLQTWLLDAGRRFGVGDYAGALKLYDQILEVAPDRAAVKDARAKAKAHESAKTLLADAQKLADTDPAGALAKVSEAEQLVTGLPKAQLLRQRLEGHMQLAQEIAARLTDADQKEAEGNWRAAIGQFSAVQLKDRDNVRAKTGLARLNKKIDDLLEDARKYDKAGKLADAMASVNELLRHDTANPQAVALRSDIGRRQIVELTRIRNEIDARLQAADKLLSDWKPADALARVNGATDPASVKKAAEIKALIANARPEFDAGMKAIGSQNFRDAATAFEQSALGGHSGAMLKLGDLYIEGSLGRTSSQTVASDPQRATTCYLHAAQAGERTAMVALVQILNRSDAKQSEFWGAKAIEAGGVNAMLDIANGFRQGGRGVIRNDASAADWYKRAVEKGSAEAMYLLGKMYEDGVGVKQDINLARLNMEAAKRKGYGPALTWIKEQDKPPVVTPPIEVKKPDPIKKDDNGL